MPPGLQALLEDTAALSQELLFTAGPDGAMLDVNPAWSRVLGWSENELQARTLLELVHPEDVDRTREATKRAFEIASELAFQARCQHKDGSWRRVSWRVIARGNVLLGAGHEVVPGESAQVVHDINNHMQTIIGALELVRMMHRTGRSGDTEKFMASAIASAHRAAELNQGRASASPPPASKTV
jgi:PAS domain S-box-containing protein